jgi:hypothetical protein
MAALGQASYADFCLRGVVPRKQKSLALLCERFCQLHADDLAGAVVSLESTAVALGSERRRLYDLLGVLTSVGVVSRSRKNAFQWCGTANMGAFLARVQAQGAPSAGPGAAGNAGPSSVPATDQESPTEDDEAPKHSSLLSLSNNFLRLYMHSGEPLSLEDAGFRIGGLEGGTGAESSKAKVRRLYDIANVLISLGLMEKNSTPDARGRTAYRWVGASIGVARVFPSAPAAAEPDAAGAAAAPGRAAAAERKLAAAAAQARAAPVSTGQGVPKRPRRAARPTDKAAGEEARAAAVAPGPPSRAAPAPARQQAGRKQGPPTNAPEAGGVAWEYGNRTNDAVLSRFLAVANAVAAPVDAAALAPGLQ